MVDRDARSDACTVFKRAVKACADDALNRNCALRRMFVLEQLQQTHEDPVDKVQEESSVRLKLANPRDFWCGVFFVLLGTLAIYLSRTYDMGTAISMGPGYFPTWLGAIAIGFGVVIGALAFKQAPPDEIEETGGGEWGYRPWLVLPATLVVYAMLMDAEVGFVPSLFALVVGCALAHRDVRWVETLILAACVTAAAVGIFHFGLELPYRLFWWSE